MARLARWPLLFGAFLCLAVSVAIANAEGDHVQAVAALFALGAALVGAWVYSLGVDDGRHRDPPPGP